jgi:PAS domain S-box-containing protein
VLAELIKIVPGFVFWKNKKLVFQGCNLQFAQQFSCKTVDEIIDKTDDDFPWSHNELKEKYKKDDLRVIETGQPLLNIEENQIQTDGSVKTVLVSKVPLRNYSGDIVGILGSYVDISYLKNIEQSLKAAKEIAESANRAKTEFIENISHDVVTPLVTLRLIGETIMESADHNNSKKGNIIARCAESLLSFFENCLKSSRIELSAWSAKEEVFSFSNLLDDIDALFSPTATMKNLVFNASCDPTLPKKMIGYRDSIYRVILNLVGNALKFTATGSVTVRVFLVEKMNQETIRVGIEVSDTGFGIPEDKQKVIFEKLHRLTPAYEGKTEGSGIGLYIVDQYVKRMGGEILVKSKVGEGSTFTVTFPIKRYR